MHGVTLGILAGLLLAATPALAAAPSLATQGTCSDTVGATICMAGDLLFGPQGVLPFATDQTGWAFGVVHEVLP